MSHVTGTALTHAQPLASLHTVDVHIVVMRTNSKKLAILKQNKNKNKEGSLEALLAGSAVYKDFLCSTIFIITY